MVPINEPPRCTPDCIQTHVYNTITWLNPQAILAGADLVLEPQRPYVPRQDLGQIVQFDGRSRWTVAISITSPEVVLSRRAESADSVSEEVGECQ
jgi:hypothetical protein